MINKNYKSLSLIIKSSQRFFHYGILNKNFSVKIPNAFQSNSINTYNFFKHSKKTFFGKQKPDDEKDKEKDIEKDDISEHKSKDKKIEKEEDVISLTKYNHLKELYEDSENNLAKARLKFDDLRKAFIENQSDLERIRKRAEIDVGNAKEFAITKFAKDLLDVYDNFDRALSSIKEIKKDDIDIEEKIRMYDGFTEGILMTKDSLNKILGIHGVKEYNPVNEVFNPSKHEAVFQSESEKLSPGMISDVVQTGFTIGSRVLRPAKVGVVKKK